MANLLGSPDTPAAARTRGPGWRDPRLWIGVAIVAASVVLGARLFAAADDTVAVYAVGADHGAGDRLSPADLVQVRVRFADDRTQAAYYSTDDAVPADLVLGRGVSAGDLLPRGSVGSSDEAALVQVPIAVEPEQVPGSVTPGALVDVYLVAAVPSDPAGSSQPATAPGAPALAGVTVLEAPAVADSFGTTGKRQLVLAVPVDDAPGFFAMLGATQSPVITVVRRG